MVGAGEGVAARGPPWRKRCSTRGRPRRVSPSIGNTWCRASSILHNQDVGCVRFGRGLARPFVPIIDGGARLITRSNVAFEEFSARTEAPESSSQLQARTPWFCDFQRQHQLRRLDARSSSPTGAGSMRRLRCSPPHSPHPSPDHRPPPSWEISFLSACISGGWRCSGRTLSLFRSVVPGVFSRVGSRHAGGYHRVSDLDDRGTTREMPVFVPPEPAFLVPLPYCFRALAQPPPAE